MSTIANCTICPGWYFASYFSAGTDDFPERDRDLLEVQYWWAGVPAYVRREALRRQPKLSYACDWCWYDACRKILNGKWLVWRDTQIEWFWVLWEWSLPAPSGFGWRLDLEVWWRRARDDFRAWWDSL